MTIVHLVAGAGEMYCGGCLHGNTLAAALREAGEDILLVPVYTPLRCDEATIGASRVAFGGVNVYLQQHSVLFRHTPWFFDRLLDRPGLLQWLGRRSGSTRPEQLGPLTVSMLRGEQGRQRKELEKLVRWLADDMQPELIHLSNVMLAGMARRLTRELDVPVVCTLSGEDLFLEQIPQPHRAEALAILRDRCAELSALTAMNGYFADFMADYLSVPRERIHVIRPGLNLAGHGMPPTDRPRGRDPKEPVTIGYLARICPEKGLHLLAEAFRLLAEDADLPPVRLAAGGYLAATDRPYLARIESQIDQWQLADRFEYIGELDRPAKIEFLQSLDVMSVPTTYRESKGLSILEAWANAVPVVLPQHGAFPELVEDTGGGLLCEPHDPASLAAALKRMILDPAFAADCGRKAHAVVHDRYHAARLAEETRRLYGRLLEA